MFKAVVLDDDLIPKLLPQAFKDFVIPEGDGGPSAIFGEGQCLRCLLFSFILIASH